jgi:TetR/AcrR family transcriptional regulator
VSGKRDSRQLILLAASQEFGRHGFAGARVDRIARSAGVNKQLIFYYFGSKAGLFDAILASLADAVLGSTAVAETANSPLEQLRATIARVMQTFAAHADLLRIALMAGPRDGGGSHVLRGALNPVAERIAALVSLGQGLGYVRDDVQPATVARQVLATALGHIALSEVLGQFPGESGVPMELLLRPLTW